MIWSNLKKNKCPQCEKELLFKQDIRILSCICGFKIGEVKFKKIISDIVGQGLGGRINDN